MGKYNADTLQRCKTEFEQLYPDYIKSADGGAQSFATYYQARMIDIFAQVFPDSLSGGLSTYSTSLKDEMRNLKAEVVKLTKALEKQNNTLNG